MEIPKKFLQQFKHKNIKFIIDEFEKLVMEDIYRHDIETTIKLNRNVTKMFNNWIITKLDKKENISLNCKGGTRTGKSVSMLGVISVIIDYYNNTNIKKKFDTEYIVCGNQKEYRQKLKDVDFGDVFQIDENAFSNVGLGSATEIQQLKDIQNIIAKKNIHTVYITPRSFLETNATLGLQTWGKDTNNWLSRFILYDLRLRTTPVLGLVIVDVGKLFTKHGCYIFKECGGCTNPKKKEINNINKDNILYSECINDNIKDFIIQGMNDTQNDEYYKSINIINDGKSCPFYNICNHPMSQYEKKKDSWIKREMSGGIDERTQDRYETALKLLYKIGFINPENNKIELSTKGTKHLKIKINLYVGTITNTKFTQTEIDEIAVMINALKDLEFFEETCKQLKLNYDDEFSQLRRM